MSRFSPTMFDGLDSLPPLPSFDYPRRSCTPQLADEVQRAVGSSVNFVRLFGRTFDKPYHQFGTRGIAVIIDFNSVVTHVDCARLKNSVKSIFKRSGIELEDSRDLVIAAELTGSVKSTIIANSLELFKEFVNQYNSPGAAAAASPERKSRTPSPP